MNVIGRSNMLITLLKSKLIIDNYLSFESFPCGSFALGKVPR